MIDKWEEEKYKQTSSVSIRHGVGGDEYVVDKLTRRSTVEDVIGRVVKDLKLDKGRWIILEKWRGTEKLLPPRTRILRVWHAWCNEQVNVQFWLQKSNHKHSRGFHDSRRRKRRQKVREEKNWSDTDSFTSDSSDSSFQDSLNTSEDSDFELNDENDLKAELIQKINVQNSTLSNQKSTISEVEIEIALMEDIIQQQNIQITVSDYQEKIFNLETEIEQMNSQYEIIQAQYKMANVLNSDKLENKEKYLKQLLQDQLDRNKSLYDEIDSVIAGQMSIQEEINSRELVLQNLVTGESGQVSYLLLPEKGRNPLVDGGKVDATKTSPSSSNMATTEYEDADNEASETDFPQWNKERLSSQDSWEEKSRSSGSSWEDARSDDTTADSGNCDSPSYDSDGLRSATDSHGRKDLKKKGADSNSINSTTDSALSSMISSENELINYSNEKFKTLTKKRVPSWRNSSIDVNISGARVLNSQQDSPLGGELSCEDDNAPFCNSEYIRKIRKHSRMFSPDTKILETSERIFRSASIRRHQELKRTQSLKTVETLV